MRVASNREPGVELERIAKDFGAHFTTLYYWMRKADIADGERLGTTEIHFSQAHLSGNELPARP